MAWRSQRGVAAAVLLLLLLLLLLEVGGMEAGNEAGKRCSGW